MQAHEYSLDRSSKKYICPECGRKKYVLYINNSTREPLHSTVGRCDGDGKCGRHYPPKQYFTDNHISFEKTWSYTLCPTPTPTPQPSFIDNGLMNKTLTGYKSNILVQWLSGIVGNELVNEAVKRYSVGTTKTGGACFWQIDIQGKVRSGKIIMYGKDGHRRKDVKPPVQWVHSIMNLPDFTLVQCLFGEHLLKDVSKTVAICESEKSAIIASCYLPEFIWLACGSSTGLGGKNGISEKCNVLRGRNVILYPDAGKFDDWSQIKCKLSAICNVEVSSLIEQYATEYEMQEGFDIADYLIRYPPENSVQNSAVNTSCVQMENDVTVQNPTVKTDANDNPVVASMLAKNPALSRLMQMFDCEVTGTGKLETQPLQMLSNDEMIRLAAGLPDYNSWTEPELCSILNIEPQHVRSLLNNKMIYYIDISGKYCRSGCTPF